MNTASVNDVASNTNIVSFSDNSSSTNTNSTSTNLTNAVNVSAITGRAQLTSLPKELRDRIYAFAFAINDQTAFILGVNDSDLQNLYCLTGNFPIALRTTCQLIHAEVKSYLTTRWDLTLAINTVDIEFQLPGFVPERYLERVRTVASSYKLMFQNNLDLYLIPELSRVFLRLPIWFIPRRKEDTDSMFHASPTTDKRNKAVRELLDEALGTWPEYNDLKAVVERYREEAIETILEFRLCLGEEHAINAVFDVEIRYLPGEEGVRITSKWKQLEESVRFFEISRYERAMLE